VYPARAALEGEGGGHFFRAARADHYLARHLFGARFRIAGRQYLILPPASDGLTGAQGGQSRPPYCQNFALGEIDQSYERRGFKVALRAL
jgi:hypothetical protein